MNEAGIKVKCSVLAIWGGDDSFLPPNRSAMRLRKYLTDSNHRDFTIIKIFKNASHFLTVSGSSDEFVHGYLDLLTAVINPIFTDK